MHQLEALQAEPVPAAVAPAKQIVQWMVMVSSCRALSQNQTQRSQMRKRWLPPQMFLQTRPVEGFKRLGRLCLWP